MDEGLDLSSLRQITGGDKALEAELFAVFNESTSECLVSLRVAFDREDDAGWRDAAHALKGASGSMGAMMLHDVCREAQNAFKTEREAKQSLLHAIEVELERVQALLKALA